MINKRDSVIKKPFLTTAISLIIVFILFGFLSILNFLGLYIFSALFSIFIFIGIILSFVGFYQLGKKYKNNLLTGTVIVGFILFISIFIISSNYSEGYQKKITELNDTITTRQTNLDLLIQQNASEKIQESYEKETAEYVFNKLFPLLIPFILLYLIHAINLTLFGIAIIRLNKVKYSMSIGVLTILSVWLIPTIIGILLAIPMLFVTYVFWILMFFSESKKAKE